MNLTISLRKFLSDVAASSEMDYASAEQLLNSLTELITGMLTRGESAYIKGIGTFRVIDDRVEFAPEAGLAEEINMPFAAFEAMELPDNVTDEMLNGIESSNSENQTATEHETITSDAEGNEPETSMDDESGNATPPPFLPPLPDVKQADTLPDTPPMSPNATEVDGTSTHEADDTNPAEPADKPDDDKPQPEPTAPHLPPLPVKPEPLTDTASPADDREWQNDDRHSTPWPWGKLAATAAVAGIICFMIGYMAGRFSGSDNDTAIESDTDTDVTVIDENSLTTLNDETTGSDTVVTAPVIPEPVETSPVPAPTTGKARTDTIGRTRFLTTMSRQHYGRMEFWVYIYEENASKLGDPNKLEAGTVVVIPPAEKYGIDANDPASVERAKAKAKEIADTYNKK